MNDSPDMGTEPTKRLEAVFRQVLGLSERDDPTSVRRESDERWDSLRHVMLVLAVESEFKISLSVAENLSISGFGDVLALLGIPGLPK